MSRIETIGDATLYLGDCREILPTLAPDVVLTDPPYGVEFRGEDWDKEVPKIATELPSLFDRVAIIMGTTAIWQFPQPKWVACWARPASSSRSKVGGFSHWSPILLYGDIQLPVDFKSWHAIANAYPPGFGHPSPKPVCVMLWLASECAAAGETILDPFMGSGTTGVAALALGRKFTGIEIDPAYFDLACRRIEDQHKRPDMFVEIDKRAAEIEEAVSRPTFDQIWQEPFYKDAAE
jgi:site-specific DNA-methyltransferase (adenine-specific)